MEEENKQEQPKSLLDEVKAERERLDKLRDEAKREADRLEKLRSDQLLSGTGGIRIDPKPSEPETDSQYRQRVQRELREGKYNDPE